MSALWKDCGSFLCSDHKQMRHYVILCVFLFTFIRTFRFSGAYSTVPTQDQTSSRPNTLLDDADDTQKQLENEARDRLKYGHTKTIWVFHFPTQFPGYTPMGEVLRRQRNSNGFKISSDKKKKARSTGAKTRNKSYSVRDLNTTEALENLVGGKLINGDIKKWHYKDQQQWFKTYPECKGHSQSPVDLPCTGLTDTKNARHLQFWNHDKMPTSLYLCNDGRTIALYGTWTANDRPIVSGGAAHSRIYVFHSLTLHLPSEHTVAGVQYPLETQALYLSSDYHTVKDAQQAFQRDPQALLSIASLYQYGKKTHAGLRTILKVLKNPRKVDCKCCMTKHPLSHFLPPFKEYACYQGSLTVPPCTEAVLWLVRGRTLTLRREALEAAYAALYKNGETEFSFRHPQSLNDRKIYYFH